MDCKDCKTCTVTTVEEMEAATARLLETGAKVGADSWQQRVKNQTPHCKFGEEGKVTVGKENGINRSSPAVVSVKAAQSTIGAVASPETAVAATETLITSWDARSTLPVAVRVVR